jgi:chemotaxis family two-component system response regulator Rcp1
MTFEEDWQGQGSVYASCEMASGARFPAWRGGDVDMVSTHGTLTAPRNPSATSSLCVPGPSGPCGLPDFRGRKKTTMSRDTVGRPMEILLVEDSLADAGLTIEALRRGDVPCRVSLVRDGEEALAFLYRQGIYAKAPRPDLILLDLGLPKKDGREVLTEIRGDQRFKGLPVVVLTGSRVHEEILKREDLQVDSYMVKPVDVEQFIEVVKSLRRFWLAEVILPPLD